MNWIIIVEAIKYRLWVILEGRSGIIIAQVLFISLYTVSSDHAFKSSSRNHIGFYRILIDTL